MVSALSRNASITNLEQYKSVQEQIVKTLDCSGSKIEKAKFYPCALRDFVNSNADLPTVEELAEKSLMLARVLGMAG
jgi:radical SAM superfamily enzyme